MLLSLPAVSPSPLSPFYVSLFLVNNCSLLSCPFPVSHALQ